MLFNRALTDKECEALFLASPSMLATYQPPDWDERFRGITAIADTGKSGRINGEMIHMGNFVMHTGVGRSMNSLALNPEGEQNNVQTE